MIYLHKIGNVMSPPQLTQWHDNAYIFDEKFKDDTMIILLSYDTVCIRPFIENISLSLSLSLSLNFVLC